MSFYNMIFGQSPLTPILLQVIGAPNVGRLRDVYLAGTAEQPEVHVYTRNGGGNRQHYPLDDDPTPEGPSCSCTGCIATYQLPAHPLYLGDSDDDFDCTYATFRFKVPEKFRTLLAALLEAQGDPPDPAQKWQAFLSKMQKTPDDPEVQRVLEALRPTLESIAKQLEEQ